MTRAIDDIAWERRRQVEQEGNADRHDDQYTAGELARAAQSYLVAYRSRMGNLPGTLQRVPRCWPWNPQFFKPRDDRRDLVRAGALLVAEIERMRRVERDETDPVQEMHARLLDLRHLPLRPYDIAIAAIGLIQTHCQRLAGDIPADPARARAPAGGWPPVLGSWLSQGSGPDLVLAGALVAAGIVQIDAAREARP